MSLFDLQFKLYFML